ncbi:MAG: 1-deoxy-D-xylulose-5-phosphate reductoisomerase, partial [Spirochaetales bacterium]|nr:1-deoxy-D-xylulose-5-phosphate reductoisomerase [Spirochaetales bacterium]
ANEIAVESFIDKKIHFTDISRIVSNILENDWSLRPGSFKEIVEIDQLVKKMTVNYIKKKIRN